jgi:hypothetical protein
MAREQVSGVRGQVAVAQRRHCSMSPTDFSPGVSSSSSSSSRSFMALPMLARLMLSGDALLFLASRPR